MKIGKHKITATFKYGRVWNNPLFGFMLIFFALISIGIACFGFVMWEENVSVGIFAFLVDVLFISLFIFEIIKAVRNRKYVIECLKDAIEKKVVAKFFDKDNGFGRNYKGVKITVSFHHKHKKIKQCSIYDRTFEAYIDKEITILYSPNNDGVLICTESEGLNEKRL